MWGDRPPSLCRRQRRADLPQQMACAAAHPVLPLSVRSIRPCRCRCGPPYAATRVARTPMSARPARGKRRPEQPPEQHQGQTRPRENPHEQAEDEQHGTSNAHGSPDRHARRLRRRGDSAPDFAADSVRCGHPDMPLSVRSIRPCRCARVILPMTARVARSAAYSPRMRFRVRRDRAMPKESAVLRRGPRQVRRRWDWTRPGGVPGS